MVIPYTVFEGNLDRIGCGGMLRMRARGGSLSPKYYRIVRRPHSPYLVQLCPPKVFSDTLQDAARDIHVVEDGEANEESRERVVHLLRKEHRNDHAVGDEPEGPCGVKKRL